MAPASGSTEAGARITALNEVNENIPTVLRAAGDALDLLTDSTQAQSMAERKSEYLKHVRSLYSSLRDLRDKLEAETKALEDAGLIAKESAKNADNEPETINTGLGSLDVGWLNSRSRDTAVVRELELLSEAKELLERVNQGLRDQAPS